MGIADAMASNGMKELGYEYINMDGKQQLEHTMSEHTTSKSNQFVTSANYLMVGDTYQKSLL